VPNFPNAVAQGARILNVRAMQAGYVRYVAGSHNIGLFVYDDKADDVDVEDSEVRNSNGYNVVTWKTVRSSTRWSLI